MVNELDTFTRVVAAGAGRPAVLDSGPSCAHQPLTDLATVVWHVQARLKPGRMLM